MKLRYLLLTCLLGVLPVASSQAFVSVSVNVAPPLLPVYAQPPCPVDGYLWTPGYYAYDDADGYYWVPGVWVAPPVVGYLWTPGYWGYNNGFYAFNQGYWGPTVGFYGGVNYGYGYGGYGYYGGRWDGRVFRYNTAITRVNTTVVHNTYVNRAVLSRQATSGRVSFNGRGGITARPTAAQLAAARGPHLAPTGPQVASRNAALRSSPVHGPSVRTGRTYTGTARTNHASSSQRLSRPVPGAGPFTRGPAASGPKPQIVRGSSGRPPTPPQPQQGKGRSKGPEHP